MKVKISTAKISTVIILKSQPKATILTNQTLISRRILSLALRLMMIINYKIKKSINLAENVVKLKMGKDLRICKNLSSELHTSILQSLPYWYACFPRNSVQRRLWIQYYYLQIGEKGFWSNPREISSEPIPSVSWSSSQFLPLLYT